MKIFEKATPIAEKNFKEGCIGYINGLELLLGLFEAFIHVYIYTYIYIHIYI